MKLEEAIHRAEEMGLGIIITEHMDINYPDPLRFCFKVEEYFKTYEKYRGDKLLLGMEMGIRPDCLEENKRLQDNYKFDYIIGSVHLVNGIDIYDLEFYEGRSKHEAYEEYFTVMLECLRGHDFIDSLGHIDYITRYARVSDPEIYYRDYAYLIDEILKLLVKNDKALEINTRRLIDKKVMSNVLEIYKRFGELGGKYVTLGSDSHKCDDIGKNFKEAEEIAEICGLNIVHFKERKMILSK
jgi:histidinol-phosphatase (PHP family)